MKEQFSNEDRKALIAFYSEKAIKVVDEADYNILGENYNVAVTRLYYSCFYAVKALFLDKEIVINSHKGAKIMLDLHFVKKGLLDKKYREMFSELMNSH